VPLGWKKKISFTLIKEKIFRIIFVYNVLKCDVMFRYMTLIQLHHSLLYSPSVGACDDVRSLGSSSWATAFASSTRMQLVLSIPGRMELTAGEKGTQQLHSTSIGSSGGWKVFGMGTIIWGHAVTQLVEALRYKPEVRGFDSRCHWNFSLTWSFRSQYGPEVDSASNRNEYQGYFLGGKGDRCVGLTTLRPSCADCL
jgi:hypothetical protein